MRSVFFLCQIAIAVSFCPFSPISFLSSQPTQISPWHEAREAAAGTAKAVVMEVTEDGAKGSQSTTAGEEKKKREANVTTGKWFPSTTHDSHLKSLVADGFLGGDLCKISH